MNIRENGAGSVSKKHILSLGFKIDGINEINDMGQAIYEFPYYSKDNRLFLSGGYWTYYIKDINDNELWQGWPNSDEEFTFVLKDIENKIGFDYIAPPKKVEKIKTAEDYIREREEKHKKERFSFKTHTLRWLFYRKQSEGMIFGKNGPSSSQMCKECKKGVSSYLVWSFIDANGERHLKANCPFCKKQLIKIPNTNISRKLYLLGEKVSIIWMKVLNAIHLLRSKTYSRYGMCGGDESYLVKTHKLYHSGKTEVELYDRKWWEYLFIRKPKNYV